MKKRYEYLTDFNFLEKINLQRLKNYYIKITLLDWEEQPIQEIQGMATGGSLSINGDSSVRRTCSLSMIVKDEEYAHITNINNLFSLNKKFYLEVGYENRTDKYKEYPVI